MRVTVVIVPWLEPLGTKFYAFEEHHHKVAELARAAGFAVCDLLPSLRKRVQTSRVPLHLEGDPVHPDPAGARAIAREIALFLSHGEAPQGSAEPAAR